MCVIPFLRINLFILYIDDTDTAAAQFKERGEGAASSCDGENDNSDGEDEDARPRKVVDEVCDNGYILIIRYICFDRIMVI